MRIFGKSNERDVDFFATNDQLVIFDDDNNTADIERITELTEDEVIVAGKFRVPRGNCKVTTGSEGRIFFYRAPEESIKETQRLASLEFNMVLSQITAYKPPVPPAQLDWVKGILFFLLFAGIILLAFK